MSRGKKKHSSFPTDRKRPEIITQMVSGQLLSGTYSTISFNSQRRILQSASSVLVETESPAFMRRIEELLICPLTCSVYVVAPVFSIVRHSGA